jgi:transcriptional regulator with XRE-family HTH domain
VRECREEAGYSIREMAEVSHVTITHLERGKTVPHPCTLRKYILKTECPVTYSAVSVMRDEIALEKTYGDDWRDTLPTSTDHWAHRFSRQQGTTSTPRR